MNVNANEFDFKKALDLLRYIDKVKYFSFCETFYMFGCKRNISDMWVNILIEMLSKIPIFAMYKPM